MVVGFFFKKVVPTFFVYYGAVQIYLVYHLYTGEAMIRAPSSPPIEPTDSRKKLVESVLATYQCRATRQIFDSFTSDVEFEDPTLSTEGLRMLENLAYMMKKMQAQTHGLKEHHFQDQFILELNQTYTLGFLGMRIPSVLYVELEGKGQEEKVKRFHDEWWGKTLVTPENTPFAFTGVSAQFFRRVQGRLMNFFNFVPPQE